MSDSLLLSALEPFRAEASGTIFVAVSGGVDSMTLLEAVMRLSHRAVHPRPVAVLHVNHGLRGEASDADETFVKERAGEYGVPCFTERLEWNGEKPNQALCRDKRLSFFKRTAHQPGDRVFLAHHLDDQAETVFLRLLRGSGLRGLTGMQAWNGPLVRPWLEITREEIRAAATAWGVPWREDLSNLDTRYERNWLRQEIFPLLEARRPGFARRLTALSEEARQAERAAPFELSYYDVGEGWTIARAADLKRLSGGVLAKHYALSRRHVLGLRHLLARGSGKYEAEGVRFELSAGLLLAEREGRFRGHLVLHRDSAGLRADSHLGTWHLPLGFPLAKAAGESAKKAYQTRRVPRFFRPAVPLAREEGRLAILLPQSEEPETYEFTPSPLAQWWLTPSVASGDPAVPRATE
jgi:tRNA(Ile)-lysidine synthetase-like protein